MTMGSRSVPVKESNPKMPVITLAMTIVAATTVKPSHMKMRQIRAMQPRVATAAWKADGGLEGGKVQYLPGVSGHVINEIQVDSIVGKDGNIEQGTENGHQR